ncbi:hypothetical protein [Streptomyces sp. NPDC021224]|uniref:hypothetical protein n=1 Tax=unclassified Streptomyces TaxID=2593676 RepID=UPI0037AB3512
MRVGTVRLDEFDLGFEVAATGGGMLLMDEYSCSVLVTTSEYEPALVRFLGCTQVKFGYPNDEALIGDDLYGDCSYGLWEVFGSDWFDRLQEKNRARFPDVNWVKKRHFAFIFHESMGEFLADEVQVERFGGRFDDMALKAMQGALEAQRISFPGLIPEQEI